MDAAPTTGSSSFRIDAASIIESNSFRIDAASMTESSLFRIVASSIVDSKLTVAGPSPSLKFFGFSCFLENLCKT